MCGWSSKRKSTVSRKAFYNHQLFEIGLKTFLSTVAFQWIKCTGYEIRTASSVTSLCFLLVSFGCYFKFYFSISVRFWFSLPLNAKFLCLCQALWVALCLNSATERNVPCLNLSASHISTCLHTFPISCRICLGKHSPIQSLALFCSHRQSMAHLEGCRKEARIKENTCKSNITNKRGSRTQERGSGRYALWMSGCYLRVDEIKLGLFKRKSHSLPPSPFLLFDHSLWITQDNPAAEGACDETMLPKALLTWSPSESGNMKSSLRSHRWSHVWICMVSSKTLRTILQAWDAFAAAEEQGKR